MVNKEILDLTKTLTEIPNFKCPTCQRGFFITNKKNILQEETAQSKKTYELLGEPDRIEYQFTCLLICNNTECKETLIITGRNHLWQDGLEPTHDPETGEDFDIPKNIGTYANNFKIESVSLPLPIISLPSEIDKGLKEIIEMSFKLFWVDPSSCANKIRIAVEYLLTTKFKIPKKQKCKDKQKSTQNLPVFFYKVLTLAERIGKLQAGNPKLAKYNHLVENLKAIKWVGNIGSHENVIISRDKLFDIYKVLKLTVDEIYSNRIR